MIPQEKTAAVARALEQAFGVTQFDDVREMTKGHTSALVLRIVVRGTPYLLRIVMRPHSIGPERYFACMRAAAEAGLAPRVLYTSTADGITLADFVEEVPFPADEALARMPAVLRALHALPPFPAAANNINTTCTFLLHPGTALDGFLRAFQAANAVTAEERDQLLVLQAELAAAWRHDPADMVSCHNDLFKPDNILFDGDRVWLVDWEAAFLNDRYAELAVVANLLGVSGEQERAFLRGYFDRDLYDYELARFLLARQLAHLFYAMAFLLIGAAGRPGHDSAIDFQEFRQRMWAGQADLADVPTKFTYGRVNLEQLLYNTRQPRYREALRIVAARCAQKLSGKNE